MTPRQLREQVKRWYLAEKGVFLSHPVTLPIGILSKQQCSFDLGSDDVLIACQVQQWTKRDAVPRDAFVRWSGILYRFSLAPGYCRKILAVAASRNQAGESLARVFVVSHGHLIPPGVEIWQFEEGTAPHKVYPVLHLPDVLQEMVQRIVEAAHPRRIVLFGSYARGMARAESDLDLLIVMPDGVHCRRAAQEIYRSLWGMNISKDIVVVTESDVGSQADDHTRIIRPALRDGLELYHAQG